jgi:hypothetical protein
VALQFRKSKAIGPLRFTLTNHGLSTSLGAGPLRVSRGADGKLRRTVRVPGVGLYDTKVVGEPPRHTSRRSATPPPAAAALEMVSPHDTSVPPSPPGHRALIIVASLVGAFLLLILLGNCGGNDRGSAGNSVTMTETTTAQPKTVTVSAQPPTVTVTAAPSTSLVTVTAAAPGQPLVDPQYSSTYEAAPPLSSSAYYANCSEARAAGAAPLVAGEPGYRSGLDRDGDGIACES